MPRAVAIARAAAASLLLVMAARGALAQWAPGPVPSECTLEHVRSVADGVGLRHLASACYRVRPVYLAALDRLDALPLPSDIPRWMSMPADDQGRFDRVTLEADVFFNYTEAYPSPEAFERLADLGRRLRAAHEIELITLSASQDGYEIRDRPVDIANARAEVIRRYLIAAGVDPHRIVAQVQPADHDEDTAMGRARDRCTRVKVLMRVAAKKP